MDDLQSFAEILLDVFRNKGYDAICAFDYDTAINIANERNFDYALLDYSLGIIGLTLCIKQQLF